MEEGANQANDKLTKGNSMNTTFIGMTSQTHEERLPEGGAIRLDETDKTTLSSADIVANSATTRQSVGKRKVRQHSQADNSQITPQIFPKTIVVECSSCSIEQI